MKYIYIHKNTKRINKKTESIVYETLKNNDFIIQDEYDENKTDLIITIGGDGTFLTTIHKYKFPNCPIVGINTGTLGFFQEYKPTKDSMQKLCNDIKNKNYHIHFQSLLEAEICTDNKCFYIFGLNEIVIKNSMSKTLQLDMYLDSKYIQRFIGDGIVISTSLGSTAYNYSLSGSIVDHQLDIHQITPIAPLNSNAYRSFTSSLLLPSSLYFYVLPVKTNRNTILVSTDGYEYSYKNITKISIIKSELQVKMFRSNDYDFWSTVKSKFL